MSTNKMAGNTQPTSVPNGKTNDDFADNISLTSTVEDEYPSDTEFEVEAIRAETFIDGAHVYLVEWSNFPLDQCTYEPEDHVHDELKAEWEAKKLEQDPGVSADFEQKYQAARRQKFDESLERHRRRNIKRKKLGIPTTRFYWRRVQYADSEDDLDEGTRSDDSESDDHNDDQYCEELSEPDEAEERTQIHHRAAEALIASKPTFPDKRGMEPLKTRISSVEHCQVTPAVAKARKTDTETKQKTPTRNYKPGPDGQNSEHSSRTRELPSSTGYQGSARRPTKGTSMYSLPTRPLKAVPAKPQAKQITARRTGQQSVNVFTGGKIRKKRTPSINSSQERFYPTARARRKSELYSRARDDQAPDIMNIQNFIAGTQPIALPAESTLPNRPASYTGNPLITQEVGVGTDLPTQTKRPMRTASETKSVLSSRRKSYLASESGRALKRVKSVRFTGVDDEPKISNEPRSVRFSGADEAFVSEPMDIDEASDLPFDSSTTVEVAQRTSSVSNINSTARQNVSKGITLASTSDRILNVMFKGSARENTGDFEFQSFKAFLELDCLHFGHTVLAETLMSQLGHQTLEHVFSGVVTSADDNDALESIAEHLRADRLGLFLAEAHFNVLVYPTKCDGFTLEFVGADCTSSEGNSLNFYVFASNCPIYQLIRPPGTRPTASQMEVGQELSMLFSKILGVRLSKLTNRPALGKPRNFYFAFPHRSLEWQRSFCCWLHTRDSRCKIYTNFETGSWSAFREKARQEPSVIIMHEAILPFARRFPGFWKLLQAEHVSVWQFSESPGLQRFLHSSPDGPTVQSLLSRIFSVGMAILVTPSFVLSQPQETFKLFKWFFTEQARVSHNKLVTAYNIRGYLYGIASERGSQSKLFKATRWKHMNEMDAALERNSSALTDRDVEASQRTWLEVDRWLQQQAEPNLPFSEENHIIYADPSIDPNDEQSLVNWFGWWTMRRSHVYRRFYVIGSDAFEKVSAIPGRQPLLRMSRNLQIPDYSPSIVNDPDYHSRSNETRENSVDKGSRGPLEEPDRHSWSRSQQYFRDGEGDIQSFLAQYLERTGRTKIFAFPVSHCDSKMADHFGDPRMVFNTYDQWWRFPFPWLKDASRMFNTYIAFFYTIREDWIRSNFPRGLRPQRHPWIVVYRPVEPHNKVGGYLHRKNELIIWDVRAGDELEENHSISLADLSWMQRELVRYVQLHSHEKMHGSVLERVWLGGFRAHQSRCRSTMPMDMTAEFLHLMVTDLQDTIPSPTHALPRKGYRQVHLSQTPQGVLKDPMALDQNTGDTTAREIGGHGAGKDQRIIFHPPRGSAKLRPMGMSDCTNDLFESSRLAKLRDRKVREMVYTYRPTLEWYEQQVSEGRQFEHIHVGAWKEIDNVLGISKPGRPPNSAASEQSMGFSRRSSLSSNHSISQT